MKIKLQPGAIAPRRATSGSAGFDLYALLDAPRLIGPGSRAKIGTGVSMEIPPGIVGVVGGRSGLFSHEGIMVNVGWIDSDYRGEVGVLLLNTSHESVTIEPGQRIAQLLFTVAGQFDFGIVDELSETVRGGGGFGSSGK